LELQVHLRHGVLSEDGGVRDITDGSGFDHVTDGESLDCLVFGGASRAVGATDGLDVTTSLLVTTVGSSLLDHDCGFLGCREGETGGVGGETVIRRWLAGRLNVLV